MKLREKPLLRFVLTVVALLPLCFFIWWYFGAIMVAPAVWLLDLALGAWTTGVIDSLTLDGSSITALSSFGELRGAIVPAAEAGNQLAFVLDTKTLSYSLPFYAALHFATPMDAAWERFFRAVLALWLLLFLGLLATLFKDMMVSLGNTFLSMRNVPPADAIALAYQFSVLIVPPLAPVLLWAYGARDVPAFRSLLPESLTPRSSSKPADRPGEPVRKTQGRPSQEE